MMKYMSTTIRHFLFFSIAFLSVTAQGQELLTLDQALSEGLENNLRIKLAETDFAIDQQNNTPGNAGMLPSVMVSSNLRGANTTGEQVFTTSPEPRTFENAKTSSFDLAPTLSWTLFDGRRMFIAKERLQLLEESGYQNVQQVLQDITAQVMKAYYQVILEQEKLAVAENTLLLSEQRLEVATSKFDVGRASKLEKLSAQVDYNEDISARTRQQQALRQAQVALNNLLARDATTSFVASDTIIIDRELELTALREQVLAQNLQLRQLTIAREVQEKLLGEARAGRWPLLTANFGYSYNTRESGSGIFVSSAEYGLNYGLGFTWTLFNGWNQQRLIANALTSQKRATFEYQQQENDLLASLTSLYAGYETNYELITLEQQNLAVAIENEDIARERYQVGRSNALEYREAQQNAASAEIRLLEAIFNTRVAEIDLLLLSGQITQD